MATTALPRPGPRRARLRGAARALMAAGLPALLAACTQPGDFGRPRAGVWNGLVDATGSFATPERGRLALGAELTDDEQALRDRAWRFLQPQSPRAAFIDALVGLVAVRGPGPGPRVEEPGAYYDALVLEPARSPASRYRALADDALADARLIPPFAGLAARVVAADALRLRGLPFARTLDDADVRRAAERVAENRCLIAWVRLEAGRRIQRYRFALEHLFAAGPMPEAVGAERTLGLLVQRRPLLDPLVPPDAAVRCGLEPPEAGPAAGEAPVVAKG